MAARDFLSFMQQFGKFVMSETKIISDFSYFSSLVWEGIKAGLTPGNVEISRALRKSIAPKSLITTLRLRKMLQLSKMIKHNGKFYSSLAVPGIPSPAFANSVRNGVLNFFDAGTPLKRGVDTALLARTPNCPLNCSHCYEKANINRYTPVTDDQWIKTVATLQNHGCGVIILTGGEPLSDFDRLIRILRAGNKDLSDFHIHTSGMTVTEDKVILLKEAGLTAAGVGIDHYEEVENDRLRGRGAFRNAVKAIDLFVKHGILVYVNFCATRQVANEDELLLYTRFVKSHGVSLIEMLEPRECGGFKGDNSIILTADEKATLLAFTRKLNLNREYKEYPVIYYLASLEGKDGLGCLMGGLSHFYIDSAGNVNPCVFMPVTFGNITNGDVASILSEMQREIPGPLKTDCPAITISRQIADEKVHPVPFETIKPLFRSLFISDERK